MPVGNNKYLSTYMESPKHFIEHVRLTRRHLPNTPLELHKSGVYVLMCVNVDIKTTSIQMPICLQKTEHLYCYMF